MKMEIRLVVWLFSLACLLYSRLLLPLNSDAIDLVYALNRKYQHLIKATERAWRGPFIFSPHLHGAIETLPLVLGE